jgi:ubiquinone/menaquinone biosynthesis C-methylase UbiE
MITIAKDTAKEKNANIEYQVGDATNLTFDNESFDAVLLPNNGLASIPGRNSRKQVLNEIHRTL